MRSWAILPLCMAVASGVLLGQTGQAQAARTIFYQTGVDIFEAGPLPEPYRSHPKAAGLKAGFKCRILGIFWAYVTISGCEPVAFRGDTYDKNPELVGAIKKLYPSQASMHVPFWQKHGRWVLGGLVLVLVVAGLMKGRRKD